MHFVLLLLLLPAPQQTPAPAPSEILERVRRNVQAELALSSNYTCVETVERTYYEEKQACQANTPHGKPKEFMRDRLRLDVAVSQGAEIFSWHGENHFTSSDISQVVQNGPRTSGQFVGFLRNIFLTQGVQFTFKEASQIDGRPVYLFDYAVPLLRSNYYLKTDSGGTIIPYHGSISVDARRFELVHVSIAGDQMPLDSGICSADTEIDYQLVNLFGEQALLPSAFLMKIENVHDLYTLNRYTYTQCREFRGVSTLRFTVVDPGTPAPTHHVSDEPLPGGLTLKASLDSEISDKDSYIGDAVNASLAEPLSVPGTGAVIPKGAMIHGVISEMQQHSASLTYWLFGIKLDRIQTGDDSYLLNAWPLPAASDGVSRFSSERALSGFTMEAARHGLWFFDGSHFRLPKHWTRAWRTLPLASAGQRTP